ncbi:MAG: sialate O-acetylesterase [Yoonia sp.]|jgi:sialate O-acetylesterase
MKHLLAMAGMLAVGIPLHADVKLPTIFSDHMVLQRDTSVPVWGWADPGEKVEVKIAGQSAAATADDQGNWRIDLANLVPGHTHTLTVSGKNRMQIKDVLIGDVWLGSGQSNMGMRVGSSNDVETEKANANYPRVRMFTVASGTALTPQQNCKGSWQVCSPKTVVSFSATAYFFGRRLHQNLNVPIGLINSSVGGTPIESWTSMDAQQKTPKLHPLLAKSAQQAKAFDPKNAKAQYDKQFKSWTTRAAAAKAAGKRAPRKPRTPSRPELSSAYPSALFNGKINPLIPFAIKGAVWYQGERNSMPDGPAELYRVQLPVLVKDWRNRWSQGNFPFAWVQLPNYVSTRDWPMIRESMLLSLRTPNTGMAITIDVGDPKDIHPKNKQAVGHRLAQWALAKVYGFAISPSGPIAAARQIKAGTVTVKFDHAEGGLHAKGGKLTGFEIKDTTGKWHPASATAEKSEVTVSSDAVTHAAGVRYAWANDPECSLYNGEDLPASPFRFE